MVQSELYGNIESCAISIAQINNFCREFEDDSEYYWDVIGASRRNISLLEARDENGNKVGTTGMVGAGTTPFYLVFPEDWFADGKVLA